MTDAAKRLKLESQLAQRGLTIQAQQRRIDRLEEMLARRDARIATLQTALRTARQRLRRIGAIAAGVDQKRVRYEEPLHERAVGE